MTESRSAGRAVVVDPSGRVLMMRGEDPADPARGRFWFTPGGGLDPGESAHEGTRRELWEELGLDVETLGPVVMHRRSVFPFDGESFLQTEVIHLVHVAAAFEPSRHGHTDLEQRIISEFRWFSPAELRALEEDSYPLALVDLLEFILANGPPEIPWVEDLTDER